MNLSIIVPGIRHQNWLSLFQSAEGAIGNYSFEMIFIGPRGNYDDSLNQKPNFKFIEDYGTPARCAQIGLLHSSGNFMTWASDDGTYLAGALRDCISLFNTLRVVDGIVIRYREGGNFSDNSVYIAHTHVDMRIFGIPSHYRIAPLGMYNTHLIKAIGGWDCRYEHLNMCNHDLAFRLQNLGGKLEFSPGEVLDCSWVPWSGGDGSWVPIKRAYFENDLPLFQQMYSIDQSTRIKIDINNWQNSPAKWEKRFGV